MVYVLIVEDSFEDVQLYKRILHPIHNAELFFASTAEMALEVLQQYSIDIFFLDVDLPGMDGFQLARKIREIPQYYLTYIIFITGYSENQLDAFKELHCYDFLVKPFQMEEFSVKLLSFIDKVAEKADETEKISNKEKMVLFSTSNGDYLINAKDITFAETYRNKCFLHTETEVYRLVGLSLKEVIEQIADEYFVRCHKSFAVNLRKIAHIQQVNYRLRQISFKNNDKIIDLSNKFYESIIAKYQRVSKGKDEIK